MTHLLNSCFFFFLLYFSCQNFTIFVRMVCGEFEKHVQNVSWLYLVLVPWKLDAMSWPIYLLICYAISHDGYVQFPFSPRCSMLFCFGSLNKDLCGSTKTWIWDKFFTLSDSHLHQAISRHSHITTMRKLPMAVQMNLILRKGKCCLNLSHPFWIWTLKHLKVQECFVLGTVQI